ncbi:MAG: dihydrofolate reductase [Lachnospiraceae bacterium]|nr:dihydrofolate reductase [Lachnospiraceae bacterium]
MKCIAAVDNNWAIGFKGKLLVSIPNDQKMFRNETQGKVVVLGRKTLETFPGGLPLKMRTNIILTRNRDYSVKDAVVVRDDEELFAELSGYDSDDIYIIGGDSVYKRYIKYCDTAIITKIDQSYESDAFFPNLDEDPDWEMVAESEEMTYFSVEYTFREYKNKNVAIFGEGRQG